MKEKPFYNIFQNFIKWEIARLTEKIKTENIKITNMTNNTPKKPFCGKCDHYHTEDETCGSCEICNTPKEGREIDKE